MIYRSIKFIHKSVITNGFLFTISILRVNRNVKNISVQEALSEYLVYNY